MDIKNYHVAQSLKDAHTLIATNKNNVIMGGGLWLKYAGRPIDTIIDMSKLHLNHIDEDDSYVTIGAMTTLRDLEIHPSIKAIGHGFLSQAIGSVMGVNFRNLATIGGTIVGKFPFSDILTPLLTLDVTLMFYPASQQSLTSYLTERGDMHRILTHIVIKKAKGIGYFKKVAQTLNDFSTLNVAVYKEKDVSIAIGARPARASLAKEAMHQINESKDASEALFREVAQTAVKELSFISDERGQIDYRQSLAKTYVYRGLKEVHNT